MREVVTFVHSFVLLRSHQGAFEIVQNLSKTNVVVELPSGAQESNAFDRLFGGRVPVGTGKAEGSVHCPRAPTQKPSEGLRPYNRHSPNEKCFGLGPRFPACPGWPGWGFFPGLGSLVLFSGSLRVSVCFFFLLLFLSVGRGRHVPAPRGRDVGSIAGAPTQEPVQGTDPRTGFFRYPSTCVFLVCFVASALVFLFLYATIFSRLCVSSLQDARWASRCLPATRDWSLLASSYPPYGLEKLSSCLLK